jgi:hypothetical protein
MQAGRQAGKLLLLQRLVAHPPQLSFFTHHVSGYAVTVPRLNEWHVLTFMPPGRLMTFSKTTKQFTAYDTSVDVVIRPTNYVISPSNYNDFMKATKPWPKDTQGFTVIAQADTAVQYEKYKKQWVQYTATFMAPADEVSTHRKQLLAVK